MALLKKKLAISTEDLKKCSSLELTEEIHKIIDEMKKDFPLTKDLYDFDMKWNQKHYIWQFQKQTKEIYEWFKKWLGD